MYYPTIDCASLCLRDPVLNIPSYGPWKIISHKDMDTAANYFQHLQFQHPDYTHLAARILLEQIYMNCGPVSFSEYFKNHPEIKLYKNADLLKLESYIRTERDLNLNFLSIKTLCRSYLLRNVDDIVTEPPQYFFMRCAICVTGNDFERILETYNAISEFKYIHSSATLFNACKENRQYSSCYIMSVNEDNIFSKAQYIQKILLSGGGLGISINGCSPAGPYNGTNTLVSRTQNGIGDSVLNILNATVISINPYNRRGSIAVYLDVWHPDVLEFIMAKMPHGTNTYTELFYGLNLNNTFMECVINDEQYHLIDPNMCPELVKGYSRELYADCVKSGRYVRKISAREIMTYIIKAQSQSGVPYLINIENVNDTSNHRHLGNVPCGNLCTEIFQYHDESETAVCNLASINISKFVSPCENTIHDFTISGCGCINFKGIDDVVKLAVKNLNTLIDNQIYPDTMCARSNNTHRPVGIGIQGLFDAIQKLGLNNDDAIDFNESVAQHLYYYCLKESALEAQMDKKSYESFNKSDFSRGLLQFDYYSKPTRKMFIKENEWSTLKRQIIKFGIKNSLLTAYMPTATVSGIFGTSEGIEPYISNVYKRSLLSGDITVINPNLINALKSYGMYDSDTLDSIIAAGGSVQHTKLPESLKRNLMTAYEISPSLLRRMAVDRARFIDQGQSFNMYIDPSNPDTARIMIQSYVDMYRNQMKNIVYYVYGKAPGKPMDPTKKCIDGLCCQ